MNKWVNRLWEFHKKYPIKANDLCETYILRINRYNMGKIYVPVYNYKTKSRYTIKGFKTLLQDYLSNYNDFRQLNLIKPKNDC